LLNFLIFGGIFGLSLVLSFMLYVFTMSIGGTVLATITAGLLIALYLWIFLDSSEKASQGDGTWGEIVIVKLTIYVFVVICASYLYELVKKIF
jgi:peptidoglycan biosynthesis protein MviN/MurJ (putative lipid II flippase)